MSRGMIGETRSSEVTWHRSAVSREHRWSRLGASGGTAWFTGLPSSGKSTIAALVERRLVDQGQPAYLLDGDNLRHGLNGDLGFDEAGRTENIRRAAHVARLFADSGAIALVALVSPYAIGRAFARDLHAQERLTFVEVWVNTPLEICEQRDPKGLYRRARLGEVPEFTGVSHPYEPPAQPDLELAPEICADDAADLVLAALGFR
jgi:adenylyl-sulfate kinase